MYLLEMKAGWTGVIWTVDVGVEMYQLAGFENSFLWLTDSEQARSTNVPNHYQVTCTPLTLFPVINKVLLSMCTSHSPEVLLLFQEWCYYVPVVHNNRSTSSGKKGPKKCLSAFIRALYCLVRAIVKLSVYGMRNGNVKFESWVVLYI